VRDAGMNVRLVAGVGGEVGAEEGGQVLVHDDGLEAALWKRNYFLRFRFLLLKKLWFRFLLLKSNGSGSGSCSISRQ
jgi:hypothetical protein